MSPADRCDSRSPLTGAACVLMVGHGIRHCGPQRTVERDGYDYRERWAAEHGFRSGGWASGFYRVFCLCGHKSVGADSASAHAYWREHMSDPDRDETAEVPDGL